jgi:hypothetical protein
MWSKGFAAEETQAAFARADELAARAGNSEERNRVYHAQWAKSLMGGQLDLARRTAEAFLREAEAEKRAMEVAVALRTLGLTCLFLGEIVLSRSHLERALADHSPEWNIESRRLFGTDTQILSTNYLALTTWLLGDVQGARRLIEKAVQDARTSDHVATIAQTYFFATMLEGFREDPPATQRNALPSRLWSSPERTVSSFLQRLQRSLRAGRAADFAIRG